MEEVSLKESDVSKLKPYPLDHIISTESQILYYKRDNDDWNNNTLIKKLYLTNPRRVNRKIKTLDTIKNSELSTYKELIIPNEIVVIGGVKSGFTINEVIDATNLSLILNNKSVHDRDKIKLLKKVGELVKRVQRQSQEFYFGDLQDLNILVGKDGEIYVVDLDSSAVTQKNAIESKYIVVDKKTHKVNKYRVAKSKRSFPSINSDIYCYNTMVLNYIAGEKINTFTHEQYYDYMEYLQIIDFPQPMIDIFINHYTDKDNENVVDYLDEIESVPRANYLTLKQLRKNKMFLQKKD